MAMILKMGIGYHRNALSDRMTSSILKNCLHIFASDIQTQVFGKSSDDTKEKKIYAKFGPVYMADSNY